MPDISSVHNQINARLAGTNPGVISSALPDNTFDLLAEYLDEMADKWETGESATPVLKDISVLGYAATGNGLYLYLTGKLTLP